MTETTLDTEWPSVPTITTNGTANIPQTTNPEEELRRARRNADYFRDASGVLWKKIKHGWKRMKEAEIKNAGI